MSSSEEGGRSPAPPLPEHSRIHDRLDAQQARRERAESIVSVLVGPPARGIALWRGWAARCGLTPLVTGDVRGERVLAAWLAYEIRRGDGLASAALRLAAARMATEPEALAARLRRGSDPSLLARWITRRTLGEDEAAGKPLLRWLLECVGRGEPHRADRPEAILRAADPDGRASLPAQFEAIAPLVPLAREGAMLLAPEGLPDAAAVDALLRLAMRRPTLVLGLALPSASLERVTDSVPGRSAAMLIEGRVRLP